MLLIVKERLQSATKIIILWIFIMCGLTAARACGKPGGRPKKVDEAMQKKIIGLYNSKELSVKEICEMVRISRPTMYKYIGGAK